MADVLTTGANEIAGHEYLAFTLGSEEYGIDILKVQEIRGYDAVTRVPDAPDYIKGVINLRGTIASLLTLPSVEPASAGCGKSCRLKSALPGG